MIELKKENGILMVKLSGIIAFEAAAGFSDMLEEYLEDGTTKTIVDVEDVEDLEKICSPIIGAFLNVSKKTKIIFINLHKNKPIAKLFTMLGIGWSGIFLVCKTLEEAMEI